MQRAGERLIGEDEYLELERRSEEKHELVNGVVVAMSGATYRHNVIATNVLTALGMRLRGGRCRAVGSDQRVHVPETGLVSFA